ARKPEGFVREDRCTKCSPSVEPGVFSYWRGRRAAPKAGAPIRLDFESLLELFRRLDGRDDDQAMRLRWIVAIILLRRRHLQQVERTNEGGREVLVVKHRHDE